MRWAELRYGFRYAHSEGGLDEPLGVPFGLGPRLFDRLPLPVPYVLLPTSPRQLLCLSLLSFRRPVRRQRESDGSPFSWSAPRPSVPSCWRAPPRPPSSVYMPTSWPATGPMTHRVGSRAGRPPWPRDQEPSEIPLAQRTGGSPNPGRKSYKVIQDCTICVSCRCPRSDSTVRELRENRYQMAGVRVVSSGVGHPA